MAVRKLQLLPLILNHQRQSFQIRHADSLIQAMEIKTMPPLLQGIVETSSAEVCVTTAPSAGVWFSLFCKGF